ncbi:MAG: rhomboid family intramembrane serine protease [Chitinophagaceae bacterium]|nr:rhomboid family intramembrane serine protease [Chitinophagaceae bacterium]
MNTLIKEIKKHWNGWTQVNPIIRFALIHISVFLSVILWKTILRWNDALSIYNSAINFFIITHPSDLFEHRFWAVLTYFFVHDNFFHLIFDILFMYLFGKIVMHYMSRKHFITLYLWGGVVAGFVCVLMFKIIPYNQEREAFIRIMGSSASTFALACALLVFIPHYYISVWIVGPVKIKWIVLFYIIISFAESVETNYMNIFCYVVGGIFGCIYGLQLKKDTTPYLYSSFWKWIKKNTSASPSLKQTYKSEQKASDRSYKETNSLVSQAEIDAILDKISDKGYESLTTEEKQKLFTSSRM